MKKFSLLFLSVLFVFSVGFGQTGTPFLDIDWELVPTPGATAWSFAEKDGRMWIANGRLFFSDDEGLNWQEHTELSEEGVSYRKVYATDIGIAVVSSESSSNRLFLSDDNGETFTSSRGYGSSTDPNGPGGSSGWFDRKSKNEFIGIYYQTDELLGENYLVDGLNHGETWQSYPHLTVGYTNDLEMTLDRHNFFMGNDTIVDIVQLWNSPDYKITLTQGVDTTYTFDFTMPDSIHTSSSVSSFRYQSGKVYMYHQDSFLVASSNFGETWEVVPSPDGSRVGRRNYQFTDAGIYWNLADGLWVTRYEDWANPAFIFDFNSTTVSSFPSGSYTCYSTDHGVFLQSPTLLEPELRENGILGSVSFFDAFGQVWWIKSKGILLRSIDEGLTWERELSTIVKDQYSNLTVFEDFENILYAHADSLIYASADDGITWNPISQITFGNILLVEKNSEGIYFYGNGRVLFSNDGLLFGQKTIPELNGKLVIEEDKLYFFSSNRRYFSNDQGDSWSPPEIVYGERRGDLYQFHSGQLWSENYQFDNSNIITLSNDSGKTWIHYLNFNSIEPIPGNNFLFRFTDVYPELAFVKTHSWLYVTFNIGKDFGLIQGPFNSVSQHTGFNYPTPQNTLVKGDFLYGYDFGGSLYRTSIPDLKEQLSDTVLIQNQISGFLYKDQNNNCSFDQGDLPIPDKVITLGDRITTTDDQGWYGIFHTSTDSIDFYTDSVRYHVNNCEYANFGSKLLNIESEDTLSIAFNPIPGITDAGLSVWPFGVFRPSGNPRLVISATNHGTAPIIDQVINVIFDPVKQNIAASNDGILVNDSTWQFSASLLAGEEKTFNLGVELSTDLTLNDTLFYQIAIPTTDDEYPADNLVALEIPVVSSFDPNDKTVFPANTPRPGETTELVYRIRFQNTGNDTAFNVTIIDTLSGNLNLYSLKMLEASHPYELQIDRENIVRWNFNNILLPDSTTNKPESHGFIYFKIETKDQLVHGDQIENLAAIYFDFNEPIITNTVVTDIVDILISTEDLSTLPFITQLQPNPTSHAATLIFELEKPEKLTIDLYNELGQNIQSVLTPQILTAGTHTIDFSLLSVPSGIYFLNIKTETGVKTVRVVKIE